MNNDSPGTLPLTLSQPVQCRRDSKIQALSVLVFIGFYCVALPLQRRKTDIDLSFNVTLMHFQLTSCRVLT
jgi:hypothetical protein